MADLTQIDIVDRMVRGVEKVRERLLRSTAALDAAGVRYAVTGDQTVALWVASVDLSAVRNSPEVELLIRRCDSSQVRRMMASSGLIERSPRNDLAFVDPISGNRHDVVRFIFASESPTSSEPLIVDRRYRLSPYWVLDLEAIVRMNLIQFRTINRLRLRDLIDAGLIDGAWRNRFGPKLAERLKHLLDTPEG